MQIQVTYPGNGDTTKIRLVLSADELTAIQNGVKVADVTEIETATESSFAEISVVDEAHATIEVQPDAAQG